MPHEHDLDAGYLHPSDAEVLDLYREDGALRVRLLVPCTDCDRPLELDTAVESVETADLEYPVDDAADPYD
jgi:hypothetical protein